MDIVIPTLGRLDMRLQSTYRTLQQAGYVPTVVVQPHEAAWWHQQGALVHTLPPHVKGISATRDHIIHDMAGSKYVLMLDDDLHFAVRRKDDPTKFRQPDDPDIQAMIISLSDALKKVPHVSIGAREGGNRVTELVVKNTRMMRVLGYDRDFMKKNCITFAPLEFMEDFHVTLQMLRLGVDCHVLNRWVSNQANGSNAKGGCSDQRTLERHAEAARMLAGRHPSFVKVVQKQTKSAWGGQERTDVIVYWKKARESAE